MDVWPGSIHRVAKRGPTSGHRREGITYGIILKETKNRHGRGTKKQAQDAPVVQPGRRRRGLLPSALRHHGLHLEGGRTFLRHSGLPICQPHVRLSRKRLQNRRRSDKRRTDGILRAS